MVFTCLFVDEKYRCVQKDVDGKCSVRWLDVGNKALCRRQGNPSILAL